MPPSICCVFFWPRSRAAGCLLWVALLIVLLIVLSLLFGGFHKGTKANGLVPARASVAVASATGGAAAVISLGRAGYTEVGQPG